MKDYQREFIEFAIEVGALQFGEFTLKSGRVSPYFFNAGRFFSGMRLARLGRCYAHAILDAGLKFGMLYGPAYKGIPLATAVAIAFAEHHRMDIPYAYNRKEAKDHAEGGVLVGAPLQGRVLIIDDVISAGISVREAMKLISEAGATPAGVVIALDRQERGESDITAVQEFQTVYGLGVISIANLDRIMEYLQMKRGKANVSPEILDAIKAYREQYGA